MLEKQACLSNKKSDSLILDGNYLRSTEGIHKSSQKNDEVIVCGLKRKYKLHY